MPTGVLLTPPVIQFFANSGAPAVNGSVLTQVGSVNTATYQDSGLTTPLPNPIPLNSRGEVSTSNGVSSQCFLTPNTVYTFTLYDGPNGTGNQLWSATYVNGVQPSAAMIGGALYPQTAAELAAGVTPLSFAYPTLNPLRYGATGGGGGADTGAFAQVRLILAQLSGTISWANGVDVPAYPQSAAEAAGTIVAANPLVAIGNASRYGADSTGTLDSTTAMQTWMNAVWAQFQYLDSQGLWSGGGGAVPIATLPPGKYKVSGSIIMPGAATLTGQARPANTVSHTRIIMNSTGITPGRTWSANAVIKPNSNIQALSGGTTYRYFTSAGGVSGATLPGWASAGNTTDGTVTWTNQGAVTAGDNRNTPIMKFSRSTLPVAGALEDQALVVSIQNMEFWCVTPGSTFASPVSGSGMQQGDYPLGGALYFDLDSTDCRIVDTVFQNTPCAIRIHNARSGLTAGDGFVNTGACNLFVDRCEFDAAGAHVWADNSALDLVFRNCDFFGGVHLYQNCTGRVVYQNCRFYGGAYVDASASTNSFSLFRMNCIEFDLQSIYDNISVYGANLLDIRNLCTTSATGLSAIVAQMCNGGAISNNTLNDCGFNAAATTGLAAVAAIKMIDCFNMSVVANVVSATDTASYNGFGILTLSSGRGSQQNFISGNAITATYNGALYNSQDRYINVAGANDTVGVNYNNRTPQAAVLGKIGVNYQATTGAQTATFTATNKPGTATTAPAKWVPITLDGVQYYLPAWT